VCDFFYPRLGGVENHLFSLAYHLSRLGHKVVIVTHSYGGPPPEKKKSGQAEGDGKRRRRGGTRRTGVRYLPGPVKVYHCPILPVVDGDALPTFTASFPLLRHIFVRERIEVVHSHQATSTLANEALCYGAELGLATVYTDHSLFGFDDVASLILNRVLKLTLSLAAEVICVSHTCRDNLILRAHLDPGRVSVIPNAVDPGKFIPAPRGSSNERRRESGEGGEVDTVDREEEDFSSASVGGEDDGGGTDSEVKAGERITVVVVSRLVYRKGVDLLVSIIPTICAAHPTVDFIVGGDGPKRLDLEEMVEREALQDRVAFLGSVPHSSVRDVLVRGDIFLNCSLTESFCIAILEAACCGLYVVSTDVGGVPEVLPPEMRALAGPDASDLAGALSGAIESKTGAGAPDPWEVHERVRGMYSWGSVARTTAEVYDRAREEGAPFTFLERMARYKSTGGLAGWVAFVLGVTLHFYRIVVEWWQPLNTIDVVPDLPNYYDGTEYLIGKKEGGEVVSKDNIDGEAQKN